MATIIAKLAVAAVAASAFTAAAVAADLKSAAVVKPLQGLGFEVGSKRAIAYYKPANGVCNLTVVMAEQPADEGKAAAPASRVSLPVSWGKTARVDTAEGKAVEFACSTDGAALTVKAVEQVAWTPKAPKG